MSIAFRCPHGSRLAGGRPLRSSRESIHLVARSASMCSLLGDVRRLSDAPVPVLIEGESGVGKELFARALHEWGARSGRRFVVGNCAAIPDTLAEAELFGHVVGAFTGALRERRGMFESAEGGTFFLDELGEMTPAVQAKLLRVLEDGEYRRLGESDARRANVRIVAATNRDLEREVREGRFREDLFYRVAVVRLRVPPVRERREEIPDLARHLLAHAAARCGRRPGRLADDAVAALCAYPWPGNVRELRNEMERLVALHGDGVLIGADALSERVRGAGRRHLTPPADATLKGRLDDIERCLLGEALERYAWNKSRVARELGMTRQGLAKKMARFGIDRRGDGHERLQPDPTAREAAGDAQ
jgi:two-component system response regulator HupR/HoxA